MIGTSVSSRNRMIVRRRFAGLLEAIRHEADGIVSFTMHHHQRLTSPRAVEHFQELPVVKDKVVIGHEHLEGCVSIRDQSGQFLTENAGGRIRNDQVETVIRVAFAICLLVIVHNAGAERCTARLKRKRQYGGISPRDR